MTIITNTQQHDTQQRKIKQILETEVACVNSLLQSLDLEYEALAGSHSQALDDVVHAKHEKIQQLETITHQREKLLSTFDNVIIDENATGSKKYLFKNDKQLTELWNELVYVAEKCREKNRVNGSIVETVSRQSRHALDILRGILPNASSASEVYDQAGQTKSTTNNHSLVRV